jgi:hypothetical protein
MAKYHGNGDENHPLVQLQLREITEDFAVTRNDNPWWDFRELYNTKAARYRIMMVIAMAFFGQWSGKEPPVTHMQQRHNTSSYLHTILIVLERLLTITCRQQRCVLLHARHAQERRYYQPQ